MGRVPDRLIDLFADRKVIPFLGSGFSLPSGAPSWPDLLKGLVSNCAQGLTPALKDEISQKLTGADLAEVLDIFSPTEFAAREYLVDQLASPRLEPSDYHSTLLALGCGVIVTTNWDTLLEQSLTRAQVPYRVLYKDIHVSQFDPDRATQVIKLHGTISDPDSIVYRRGQYDQFWESRPLLLNLLCTLMATKSMLFVGYGFGDPNVRRLFDLLRERLGAPRREHYSVSYRKSDELPWTALGVNRIDLSKEVSPGNYALATAQFLKGLQERTAAISLTNEERAILVNNELERINRAAPPKPTHRMRGALGWLSNPVPVPNDPIYGTARQDELERKMTELLEEFLVSVPGATVRCILHVSHRPLLERGYQPHHLIRRLETLRDLMNRFPRSVMIVHDATPSSSNQMVFDDSSSLLGFKQARVVGINRTVLNRSRVAVREQIAQFDADFQELHLANQKAAVSRGLETAGMSASEQVHRYIAALIEDELAELRTHSDLEAFRGRSLNLAPGHSLFAEAMEFALFRHRKAGQTREDGSTPYGVHPVRVVERLRSTGLVYDYEVLAAGALHDVVEDCDVAPRELEQRFGSRIAGMVMDVSRTTSQTPEQYVAQLQAASMDAKTIKLADRWDNVIDLCTFRREPFGDRTAAEYLREARLVLSICGQANARLADALANELESAGKQWGLAI